MKTYICKLQIDPTNQERLLETFRLYNEAYNSCSQYLYQLLDNKEKLSIVALHAKAYKTIREQIPDLPSIYVVKAENDALAAYRSIKSNKHKIDKPVLKRRMSIRLDKCSHTLRGLELKFAAIGGKRIKATLCVYPKMQELLEQYTFGDPLVFMKNGELYIALTFKIPEPPVQENYAIGIDLGKRLLFVTSEGYALKGNEYNRHKRRIRYNKRSLQSKKKKSHSARKKLKKLRRREANFSRNYCHHVANVILQTRANTIVLEDLSKIKSKKNPADKYKNFNSRSQIPFYLLRSILEYKAQHAGKRVLTVSAFNTSKKDSRGLRSGERVGRRYYGRDGVVLDSDWNASINIVLKHDKHPASFILPLDGSLKPCGRANINWPIVSNYLLQANYHL